MIRRSVLITGASRGIGKAVKDKFVEKGYTVYSPNRTELDLSKFTSVNKFIENNIDLTIDVLINNAGINPICNINKLSFDDVYETINVNMISALLLVKAFSQKMVKQKYGRIVNIGSIWAIVSKEGRSIYSMTKNALHGLTNTAALEFAKYNILVNTVCPGFTNTELTLINNSNEQLKEITESIPLGRLAETKEIAEFVYYLSSEKNTYITGQKICIDGGFTIK